MVESYVMLGEKSLDQKMQKQTTPIHGYRIQISEYKRRCSSVWEGTQSVTLGKVAV